MEDDWNNLTDAPWAVRVRPEHASAAAAMRLTPDVRACLTGNDLWLRGDRLTESVADQLARLAPVGRYAVSRDDALTAHGHRLPRGHLPTDVPWLRAQEFFDITIPRAILPASPPPKLTLRLVRSTQEHPATILLTPLATLVAYADTASAIRLARLRFAATRTHVLVQGTPLPPLPGTRYSEHSNIAIPCGYTWHPPIDAPSLSRLLALAPGDLALLNTDGTHQRIPADAFVRATRSAVRLTLQSVAEVAP